MIVAGRNDDGSVPVRVAASRTELISETNLIWYTGDLTGVKTVALATQPSSSVSRCSVFVWNQTSQSVTVKIYVRQVIGGVNKKFLLTSFTVAAAVLSCVLVDGMLSGGVGCTVDVLPAAGVSDSELVTVVVREAA